MAPPEGRPKRERKGLMNKKSRPFDQAPDALLAAFIEQKTTRWDIEHFACLADLGRWFGLRRAKNDFEGIQLKRRKEAAAAKEHITQVRVLCWLFSLLVSSICASLHASVHLH